MTQDIELKVGANGHESEEETQEELQTVLKNLQDLKGPQGQLVTFGKPELGLLQKMLSTATEKYREEQMWRMMDFINEDEALDHIAAYYEARDLGMDTSFNVAFVFALCSVNRKGGFRNNLIAIIGDILQHGKWAGNSQYKKGNNGNSNPRSPIGN